VKIIFTLHCHSRAANNENVPFNHDIKCLYLEISLSAKTSTMLKDPYAAKHWDTNVTSNNQTNIRKPWPQTLNQME
jgi:hypothetical protein